MSSKQPSKTPIVIRMGAVYENSDIILPAMPDPNKWNGRAIAKCLEERGKIAAEVCKKAGIRQPKATRLPKARPQPMGM